MVLSLNVRFYCNENKLVKMFKLSAVKIRQLSMQQDKACMNIFDGFILRIKCLLRWVDVVEVPTRVLSRGRSKLGGRRVVVVVG